MKLATLSAQLTKTVAAATATFNAVDESGVEIPGASFTLRSPQSNEVRALNQKHEGEETRFLLSWGDISKLSDTKLADFQRYRTELADRHFAERMRAAFVSADPSLQGDDGSVLTADDFYRIMLDPEHRVLQLQVAVFFADKRNFRPLASRAVATPAPTSPLPQILPASEISHDMPVGNSN